jgi:hypothetical protein
MNEEQTSPPLEVVTPSTVTQKQDWLKPLTKVTPLSKALAMLLFIALPFVGFWLGMNYSTFVDSFKEPQIEWPPLPPVTEYPETPLSPVSEQPFERQDREDVVDAPTQLVSIAREGNRTYLTVDVLEYNPNFFLPGQDDPTPDISDDDGFYIESSNASQTVEITPDTRLFDCNGTEYEYDMYSTEDFIKDLEDGDPKVSPLYTTYSLTTKNGVILKMQYICVP